MSDTVSHCPDNGWKNSTATSNLADTISSSSHPASVHKDSPLPVDLPHHPYNWRSSKKWTHVILFGIIEFITPLASMMMSPAIPQIAADLANVSITRTTFSVSVYVLGFVVGPLLFGPLSSIYGRIAIYRTTVAIYGVLSVGCALTTSVEMLTALRFFGGCFGAAPIVIGGASVADMYRPAFRGRPMAVYSVGPFLGLTMGPIFGGLLNYYCGWRWIFWSLSIAAGILSVCTFVVLRETHLPTICRHLEKQPQTMWQRLPALYTAFRHPRAVRDRLKTVILPAFAAPVHIAFSNMPLFLLFIANAVFTGVMNVLFTTLGATYQSRYAFSARNSGLAYLSITIGGIIAAVFLGNTGDKIVAFMARRQNNRFGQEERLERWRLPPIVVGDLLSSAGLIWYGWAVQAHSHWVLPLAGALIFGLGMLAIQAGFPTFLIHAYSDQASAVLSASVIARSIGGSTITLAGPGLNTRLGYGWASTLLAAVNLLFLLPAAILFSTLRTRR